MSVNPGSNVEGIGKDSKFQNPNSKQVSNSKIQIPDRDNLSQVILYNGSVWVLEGDCCSLFGSLKFGNWNLFGIWVLELGIY
jgi:hypothetical protein